jgi:hypothetical protein
LTFSRIQPPQRCLVLRFTPHQIRATICRFYMMTRTLLSAANLGQQGEFYPEPYAASQRSAGSAARQHPEQPAEVYLSPLRHQRPQLLIANLELEFDLTHTKLGPLKISNRKFSPILRLQFLSRSRSKSANKSSATYQRSLCILIHGSAIKTRRNLCIDNNLEISNRR